MIPWALVVRCSTNGCYRRNLVIAGRSGEGPFTMRFADTRYRALPTGGLSRLRSWGAFRTGKNPWREVSDARREAGRRAATRLHLKSGRR